MKWPYEVIIFDVDGVLVDVRETFQRTVLETVRRITGRRVSRRELHEWKNRPGFNDDWTLTHAWVSALGSALSYGQVKEQFEDAYWGSGSDGYVSRERWMLSRAQLRRLASKAELAIFTGRTHGELEHTLERFSARDYFSKIVTVEDVSAPKPAPEGLLRILRGRAPSAAVYLGDNVDDALAAKSAGVPFLGVLPRRSVERRIRAAKLRELGAQAILGEAREIEKWISRAPTNSR